MNMLERFSTESCPMNRRNRAMIKEANDLCDEIAAKIAEASDFDDINDVVSEYRPLLLKILQEIIDYNSVDYIVMDAATSHIIVDPELPDFSFFFAVTNPRHMAWADKELTKELTEKGLTCRSMRREGRWDD